MRSIVFGVAMLAACVGVARAQKPETAQQILADATAKAAAEHKVVFLDLGATWCVNCHRLDAFLASPEIAPIMQKYFVFADVHYDESYGKHPELETPGAEKLMERFGDDQGVPYLVFFGGDGEPIVTSTRPVAHKKHGENVGYPDGPEEIEWFMTMLQKAVPAMSPDEILLIDSTLRHLSSKHLATAQ